MQRQSITHPYYITYIESLIKDEYIVAYLSQFIDIKDEKQETIFWKSYTQIFSHTYYQIC